MFLQGNLPERTIKTSYHPGSPDGKENKTQTTSAREARQILTNELIFFLPSFTGVHWSLGSSTRRLSKVALTVSQFN